MTLRTSLGGSCSCSVALLEERHTKARENGTMLCPGKYQRPFPLHLALELPHGEDECSNMGKILRNSWEKLVSLEKYHACD